MAAKKSKVKERVYVITDEELAFTQKHLDDSKYLESQKCDKDLSGLMNYCENCPHRVMQRIDANSGYCDIDHETRCSQNLCAKHVRGV